MRRRAILAILAAGAAAAQSPDRVMGVVTEVWPEKRQVALRSDDGQIYGALAVENAALLRVEPGERDMSKAEKIAFEAIAKGDRLLVRGAVDRETRTVTARTLVVMSGSSLAARQGRELAAWRAQSLGGVVHKVDSAGRMLTVIARAGGPGPVKEWAVSVPADAVILRYASGSVRFADSRPAAMEDIHQGDQVRVRGPRDEERSTVRADAIVFGGFRTVAGEIKSVNAARREVAFTDLETKKPVVVQVGETANLRKMMASPRGRPPGAPGMPDFQRLLERLPAARFEDLQPGDAMIASVASGGGSGPLQAVTLVTGVDALVRATPAALGQMVAGWSLEMNMPQ